ncbi:MAG: response regulator [Lachnospiraceae bacterium]|nr:response regulator [Lachnospiraceae bacterium]
MRGFFRSLKNNWKLLGVSIYTGERLERNLSAVTGAGVVLAFIGAVMTIFNIVGHKGFVTVTTALCCLSGIVVTLSAKILHDRKIATGFMTFTCALFFSYYALWGVNDGFAILWTLLVPIAICNYCSVRHGIILSFYYEALFIVLFYTPASIYVQSFYSETFMKRFPVLYLCGLLLNAISMGNYHISTLRQIEYEEKLKEAADAAISADRAKSVFLAQMSHEIRTPINAVLGMNEMILRETEDREIKEYANNINSAGRNLLSLINSILDFSKIEDGKMELVSTDYQIASMVNDLVVSVEERAKTKGLKLTVDVDESLPSVLYGDDVRLSQIILNLLTNAIKYTETGEVTFSVKKLRADDGILEMAVSVRDTGIGIKEEDMDRLFATFERLDEKRNKHIEGTGLGMSIVTRLLELMNSSLQVKSTYGEGSEFSFTISQKIVDDTPVGDYRRRAGALQVKGDKDTIINAPGAGILVVDDNEMNLKVAKNFLRLCGIKPDLAKSGQEAIDKMSAKKYNMVFLDHMMPVMDGIEALGIMKKQDLVPESTIMVALTANAVVGARQTYIDAGFDDYLTKPLILKDLVRKLVDYLPADAYIRRKSVSDSALDENEIMEFGPEDDVVEYEPGTGEETGTEAGFLEKLKAEGIDAEAGLSFCGGSSDFYREMLSDFATSAEGKAGSLEEHFKAKEWNEYKVMAHSLKSISMTLGIRGVSDMARRMEDACKSDDEAYILANHANFITRYYEARDTIIPALQYNTRQMQ